MSILRERRPIAKRCIAAGLYQKLVNKLGSSFIIKQNRLAHLSHQVPQGEFLHVIHQARNVFVFVAHTNADGRRQALSEQDVEDLLCFQQALLPTDLLQHAYRLAPFLIIAANDKNQYAHLHKKGFCFMSKMVVSSVVSIIKNEALAKASPAIQRRLQTVFSPETVIPSSLSANEPPFLDQTQDKILKQSLFPTSYASRYTSNAHLYQGTAGSGKTLVLLQRAKLLKRLHPTWNLLIIAPNTASLHMLKKMQRELDPDVGTKIICFQQWCRSHIKGVLQFIHTDEALEFAVSAVERHFKDQRLTAEQLLQELVYNAEHAIGTLDLYLATEHADFITRYNGQLDSLVDDDRLRKRIWGAMQDVVQALRLKNLHMMCDLAPLLWHQVVAGKVELPKYDAVFIDDAHALAPVGFKLLKQACESMTGHLFMMAERVQSVLPYTKISQSYPWRKANIRVTEHETVLSQCYRTSADILRLANKFFQVENQPAVPSRRQKSIKRWRWPYKSPVLFHLTKNIEELDLLVKEIRVLLDRGMHAKDILIVYAGSTSLRQLALLLRQQLNLMVSLFGDPQQSEKTIYIAALDDIAAVESPVVFIIGLQHLFSAAIHEEGETSHHALAKLYRGTMCAQHQLTFILAADSIPQALQLKELKVVKNPTKKNNVYPLFPT